MMEGEKMESHQKGFLKLKYFSPLRILTPPLFEETLRAFLFFLFSYFFLFFLFSAFSILFLSLFLLCPAY
jgi:hypothetical protein